MKGFSEHDVSVRGFSRNAVIFFFFFLTFPIGLYIVERVARSNRNLCAYCIDLLLFKVIRLFIASVGLMHLYTRPM